MKEFIKKLIGRLEEYPHGKYEDEYGKGFSAGINASIEEVNELAEEYRNDKVCQTAIMYAKNLHKYGVQIDSIWETATQQSMALNQAYMRGRQDERDIFDEWQEKHINTSTDTSSDISTDTSSGWIPCSRELPKKSGKYLITQERYSLEDRLCKRPIAIEVDYVVFNATDNLWARASFFKVIAWMPLPAPYKEGCE